MLSGNSTPAAQCQLHAELKPRLYSPGLLPIRATHHLPLALIASLRINPELAAVLDPLRCGSSTSSVNSASAFSRSGLIKVGRMARNSNTEATRFASPSLSPSSSSCPAQSMNPGSPGAASSLEYRRAKTNAAYAPSLPGLYSSGTASKITCRARPAAGTANKRCCAV